MILIGNPNPNVSNKVVFTQCGKNGDDEGETKDEKQKPRRNLDHITWNDWRKVHYMGNNECSTQTKTKEDSEAFRKMNKKSGNKPPDGG